MQFVVQGCHLACSAHEFVRISGGGFTRVLRASTLENLKICSVIVDGIQNHRQLHGNDKGGPVSRQVNQT